MARNQPREHVKEVIEPLFDVELRISCSDEKHLFSAPCVDLTQRSDLASLHAIGDHRQAGPGSNPRDPIGPLTRQDSDPADIGKSMTNPGSGQRSTLTIEDFELTTVNL